MLPSSADTAGASPAAIEGARLAQLGFTTARRFHCVPSPPQDAAGFAGGYLRERR